MGDEHTALWASVMHQAIKDLSSKKYMERNSAKYWITRRKNNGIGSFVWICKVLGWDADKVRTRVLRNIA